METNFEFQRIAAHVGHKIECVIYGPQDNPSSVTVECIDCSAVIASASADDGQGGDVETNFDIFFKTYAENLVKAVEKHPDQYFYSINDVPKVVAKMKDAVKSGSYNKNGFAFKWTCKDLGIPYTYKAIQAFINS